MSQHDPLHPPDAESQPEGELQPRDLQAGGARSPSVQATMNQMTERLQTVIDAAERAADAIRSDAEEQARRHLAESQRKADRMTAERVRLISELTDDLIHHAGQVRDHSEQMVRSLEDAIDSVTGKLEQPGLSDPFTIEDATLSPDEAPSLPPGPPAESEEVTQEALVHATRLAVAGNDRETIATFLRHELGVQDPDAVVDRILGS